MKLPFNSLQKKIYELLTANLTYSVYDIAAIPQNTQPPYIAIGDVSATNDSTKTYWGVEVTVTIHMWSKYEGLKEINDMMDAVTQTLVSKNNISLEGGFTAVGCLLDMVQTIPDPAGRHGILRFRFYIKENT